MNENRPSVIVQTVYFEGRDRGAAVEIGRELYEHLVRPLGRAELGRAELGRAEKLKGLNLEEDGGEASDGARRSTGDQENDEREESGNPLAHGSQILVFEAVAPDRVDIDAADVLVVVPVIGEWALNTERRKIFASLQEWHDALGPGHVLTVPLAANVRALEARLPIANVLSELYDKSRRRTIDEILVGVARLLRAGEEGNVQLFLSHAKRDLEATEEAALQVFNHVFMDTRGKAFFDNHNLAVGYPLREQIEKGVKESVLVAFRSDNYSARAWCQEELLLAKEYGLPILTVHVLVDGEGRSMAYGGNHPSVVWNGDPAPIVTRALVEFIRAEAFKLQARNVIRHAQLPKDTRIFIRPPELLDLSIGQLRDVPSAVVIHPDPELFVVERRALNHARPRLRVVTPTTSFRRVLPRQRVVAAKEEAAPPENPLGRVANPLEARQVALSISVSPDVGRDDGYTEAHVRDTTAYVSRSLISAGASIAYGGNFPKDSYTAMLGELITAYGETAPGSGERLRSYLAAIVEPVSTGLDLEIYHLDANSAHWASLPRPSERERPQSSALYFSDMRRVMAEQTDARIVLGGQVSPRLKPKGRGYGGRYPGVVEEAWWTLEAHKPLYVIGGYGGAGAMIADLLEDGPLPEDLKDRTWMEHQYFRDNAAQFESDPFREKLGLPSTMEEMGEAIRRHFKTKLADPLAWNGLTREENRYLARSRDPVFIASLVMRGLLNVTRSRSAGRLRIELVRGSVTRARNLDAVAVSVLEGQELGGAGAAIDAVIDGKASMARAGGFSLLSLEAEEIDADWLYFASLGNPVGLGKLQARIGKAAQDMVEVVERHGFRRVGVVAFGAALGMGVDVVTESMVEGFSELPDSATLVWFENDGERFTALHRELLKLSNVEVTTREVEETAFRAGPASAGLSTRDSGLAVHVELHGEELKTTVIPPAGRGAVASRTTRLSAATLEKLSRGVGHERRRTPPLDQLRVKGLEIGELLFGDEAGAVLSHCRDAAVTIVHDIPSSQIPFELLLGESEEGDVVRPATGAGLNRHLKVSDVPFRDLLGHPPLVGRLKLLMVINPTEDLPGTEREAARIKSKLDPAALGDDDADATAIKIVEIRRGDATIQRILDELKNADILHFGGHGFYEGPGEDQSGLFLADGKLTLSKLRPATLALRFAFVNSCEAGRVRAPAAIKIQTEAAAFAEIFLRSGIGAYLGSYWELGDSAAAAFAADVYESLATGDSLHDAVRRARAALFDSKDENWGNYLLYGDGRFRLMSE